MHFDDENGKTSVVIASKFVAWVFGIMSTLMGAAVMGLIGLVITTREDVIELRTDVRSIKAKLDSAPPVTLMEYSRFLADHKAEMNDIDRRIRDLERNNDGLRSR